MPVKSGGDRRIDPKLKPLNPDLARRLACLPTSPGVYLFRDSQGRVIYIGKAKNLRARVRSYVRGGDERAQMHYLISRLSSLETMVTGDEKQALVLESSLIKQYKPRYNVRLKDDKSYVSVKVTLQDNWPRVYATRKVVRDGAKYYGPFTAAYALHQTLETIRKVFPLRTCSDTVFRNRSRPCLEYQIKRCLGPCCLCVDEGEYRKHLRGASLLLEGKDRALLGELRQRMEGAAAELRFEEAARLRDQISAIERTIEQQKTVSHGWRDQDAFGLYREGGFIEVSVLFIRQGRLTGNQAYSLDDFEFPDSDVLEEVITQFYRGGRYVPDEILLPVPVSDGEMREDYLSERRGTKVALVVPSRGNKLKLVGMAEDNARQGFLERRDARGKREKMIEELRRGLRLTNAPKRIECFDISNIQGRFAVGSMVTFDEGEPDTSGYRKFKVRTVDGADDLAMMYEVLLRRYRRVKEGSDLPDLVVVDGGKGQLNVAVAVFRELGITEVDAVGLAKKRVERAPRAAEISYAPERVFVPGRKNPIMLRRNSTALFLLQRIRDEAHRFAVTYHKQLRKKAKLRSGLEDIEGVGGARRRALLRHFGSMKRVSEASNDELLMVPGISRRLAGQIKRHLGCSTRSGKSSA